jgi:hypothetical protein
MSEPVDYVAQANLIHENGPAATPPSTLFFTYLKPDGESIVGPATSAEVYLREGFTITGEQTIESVDAYNAEQAAKAAPKAERETHAPEHESRHQPTPPAPSKRD